LALLTSPSLSLFPVLPSSTVMTLRAAILAVGVVLLAGVNAQNATYNALVISSMYTPASSPAKCSPDGTITVTQINQAYTEYVTQWATTTYTDSKPGKTITTCTGSMGGYGSTTTVTATTTTSLSCTEKPTTVTSYQNCIPVSHHELGTQRIRLELLLLYLPSLSDRFMIESYIWLSQSKADRQEKSCASIL